MRDGNNVRTQRVFRPSEHPLAKNVSEYLESVAVVNVNHRSRLLERARHRART